MSPLRKFLFLTILTLLIIGVGYEWFVAQDKTPSSLEISPKISDSGTNPQDATIVDIERAVIPATESTTEVFDPGQLRGRVIDSDGSGLAGIKLRLRTLRGSSSSFILREAVTDASGEFVLENLDPDGIYLLFTEATPQYPGYRRDGFRLNEFTAPFDIVLEQPDLVDVDGSVVNAEYVPVGNFTLTVEALDFDYPPRTFTSDVSGYFHLPDFPVGQVKLFTATPEYFRIRGLRVQGDVYNHLTLVIDQGSYKLSGRVLDEQGSPIEQARVTLSSMIVHNEYDSNAYRTRMTDASGSFEFAELGVSEQTLGIYAIGYKPYTEHFVFQSFSDQVEIKLSN